jgi:osmotically-inducible protein OsmY
VGEPFQTMTKTEPFRRGYRIATGTGILLLITLAPLAGCSLAVGAGATAGVAASQERGLGGAIKDTTINTEIAKNWINFSPDLFVETSADVHEGRVLLTGTVSNPQVRLDAVRLAWQADGVRQMINEIQVTNEGGVADFAQDSWITGQLRAKITFDTHVLAINYSIETVNGVIYLMGIAQDPAELDRVIRYARNIKYVKNVISHVRIKGTPIPGT